MLTLQKDDQCQETDSLNFYQYYYGQLESQSKMRDTDFFHDQFSKLVLTVYFLFSYQNYIFVQKIQLIDQISIAAKFYPDQVVIKASTLGKLKTKLFAVRMISDKFNKNIYLYIFYGNWVCVYYFIELLKSSDSQIHMKLFDYTEVSPKAQPYLKITADATQMIIQIARQLDVSLVSLHTALWIFHCNAIIMTYHNFDRYIYACGALLVGCKLTQNLRSPVHIIEKCRKKLRKRKNIDDQDSKDQLKVQIKKMFDAEVNIMINIGFDLDIMMALQISDQMRLHQQLDSHIYGSLKQTLTSLYKTQVVVLFEPITILCLAIDIVLKTQGRSIELFEINSELKEILKSDSVKQSKKQYLKRSGYA